MKSIRKIENLHIVCWLLKDTCWVMDMKALGIIMIVPTLFLAFYITVRFRTILSEFFHNIAVCCWIVANTIWMIGEFYFDDTLRPYSIACLLAGLLVLAVFYIFVNPKIREEAIDS